MYFNNLVPAIIIAAVFAGQAFGRLSSTLDIPDREEAKKACAFRISNAICGYKYGDGNQEFSGHCKHEHEDDTLRLCL